jgi:DNA ligase (NAD+)
MFKKTRIVILVALASSSLVFSENKTEVAKLEAKIVQLRKSFWEDGVRKISDQDYDLLLEKLAKLSPNSPALYDGKEKLPTTISRQLVKHSQPMRSLRKCYDRSELLTWCKEMTRTPNERFIIQPKYDGVAVELRDGTISTRGNGNFGANISNISKILRYLPKKPNNREVGELLLSDVMFKKLQNIDPKYISSRHAVVGMLSAKDISFWEKNGIVFDFVCYYYVQKEFTAEQLAQNWDHVIKWVKHIGYLTDGFVVKISDTSYYKQLGTTQAYPKGAMAFKWGCERKWTKLLAVNWQQGKHRFNPVGELSDIKLDGKSVRKVSLHSLDYIRKHNLTIGSRLQIECVGGTVPVVKDSQIATNGKKIELVKCPDCQQSVSLINGEYICSNKQCPAKVVIEIYENLKKNRIKGFGKKTIKRLVIALGLKSWDDLKSKTVVELESVKGIGHQKAEKLKEILK